MYIFRNYNLIFLGLIISLIFNHSANFVFANIPFISIIVSIFVATTIILLTFLLTNLTSNFIVKELLDSGRYKFFIKEIFNTLLISIEHFCISIFVYIFEIKSVYLNLLILTGVLLFYFIRLTIDFKDAMETNEILERIKIENINGQIKREEEFMKAMKKKENEK